MLRGLGCAVVTAILGGCSSIPDIEYSYYPQKSNTTVTITQTIACNKDQTAFLVVTAPSIATSYAADYTKGPYKIRIKDIEGSVGTFADSDATFTFTDDGRLKGINQNTTGQGEAVVKSAVTLGTTLAALADFKITEKAKLSDECDAIAHSGADGKAVSTTLSYALNGDLTTMFGEETDAPVAVGSQQLFDRLNVNRRIPRPKIRIGYPSDIGSRADYGRPCGNSAGDVIDLKLQRTSSVKVDILVSDAAVWSGLVTVPKKESYCLPIPKAALFGKQNFSLTLSDSGTIASIDYGKVSGAAGSLNAANSIATAVSPETPNAKAAELKAQADIIAQQQRLMRCQANPSTCQ